MLRIYKFLEKTQVEGPNIRFCIWVQGCSRHCEGCFAKATWAHNRGELISINDMFKKISMQKDIEGVTFLGGEPFEQAKALSKLAKKIKKAGLGLLTFTGYTIEELKELKNRDVEALLSYTDLLIDSPFEIKKLDISRPWVGSLNQRYLFLTDRYKKEDIEQYKNKVEIRIAKNGTIFLNGMGDFSKLQEDLAL